MTDPDRTPEALTRQLRERAQEIPQEIADRENSCCACIGNYGHETWDDYSDDPDRQKMLEAADVITDLHARLAKAKARAEAAEALVRQAADLIEGDLTGSDWKRATRSFCRDARQFLNGKGSEDD
jgi:hypothetical protein